MGDTRRVISHVLFDLYGTLGFPPDEVIEQFREGFRSLGFTVPQAARIDQALSQNESDGMLHLEPSKSAESYRQWLLQKVAAAVSEFRDPDEAVTVANELLAFYETIEYEMTPVPGTRETLADLRRDGLTISVCSNWSWGLDNALQAMGIHDLVDHSFSSAWLGARKPHPEYFIRTLQTLQAEPENCVFVGDTWEADILGSSAAGMRPVFVRTARKAKGIPPDVSVCEVDTLLEVRDYVRSLRKA